MAIQALPEARTCLAELENQIEQGRAVIAIALWEIKQGQYYRETHGTFEEYCKVRWGISRVHGTRLVNAAGVTKRLEGRVTNWLHPKESHLRHLVPLADSDQLPAYEEAVRLADGKELTASHFEEAAAQFEPARKNKSPRPDDAPRPSRVTESTPRRSAFDNEIDALNHTIDYLDFFVSVTEDNPLLTRREVLKKEIARLQRAADTLAQYSPTQVLVDLPGWLDAGIWDQFVMLRGKNLTAHGARLIIARLDGYRQQGHDANACIEQSIERGWAGIFPVKPEQDFGNGDKRTGENSDRIRSLVASIAADQPG